MLRNHWYIACASCQLGTEPRAVQVLDEPLAVFRDEQGRAHALRDHCSHRGTPLSLGEVVQGTLACRYHGWRFDGQGACRHIPSLMPGRSIPAGCEVPAFPCEEHDGYVWVWLGNPGVVLTPCPRLPEFAQHAWQQGSWSWRCSAARAMENHIDWCHAAFAHRGGPHPQAQRVQQHGLREQAYELRLHAHGLVAFSPPTADERDPLPEPAAVMLRFELPDRMVLRRRAQGLLIVTHFVPTGPSTCRIERLLHHEGMAGQGVTWTDEEPEILAEDRRLLEPAQAWYDRHGTAQEHSVEADAGPLLLRRVLDLAGQGRWHQEWAGLRQRRVVAVRA